MKHQNKLNKLSKSTLNKKNQMWGLKGDSAAKDHIRLSH